MLLQFVRLGVLLHLVRPEPDPLRAQHEAVSAFGRLHVGAVHVEGSDGGHVVRTVVTSVYPVFDIQVLQGTRFSDEVPVLRQDVGLLETGVHQQAWQGGARQSIGIVDGLVAHQAVGSLHTEA